MTKENDTWTFVDGADYCATESSTSFSWFDIVLSNRYEIKTQHVGMGEGCTREGQIQTRVVRATNEGFEMEAGQRHAEFIIEQLQLQAGKGVSTPGIDQDYHDEDTLEALGSLVTTSFRRMAARRNNLRAARPDICPRSRSYVVRWEQASGEVDDETQEGWTVS